MSRITPKAGAKIDIKNWWRYSLDKVHYKILSTTPFLLQIAPWNFANHVDFVYQHEENFEKDSSPIEKSNKGADKETLFLRSNERKVFKCFFLFPDTVNV